MSAILMAALVVVVAFALAEITLRLLSRKLRLRDWGSWEIQNKVSAMDRLAQKGGASVVCVGTSHVQAGIDPALMTSLLGFERPAFNAAINGCTARMVEPWLRDVILPRLKPDLVIFGFNTEQTEDNSYADKILRRLQKSPEWRRMRGEGSLARRLVFALERVSYVVRYRWLLPRKRREKKKEGALVSDLGYLKWVDNFREFEYGVNDLKVSIWREALKHFHMGGEETEALGRIVDVLREKRVRVLLIQMPCRLPDWLDYHPNGIADFEQMQRVTRAFIAERDVPFIDAMPYVSPDDFADPLHVNRSGQEKLTRLFAEASRDALSAVPREATPGR